MNKRAQELYLIFNEIIELPSREYDIIEETIIEYYPSFKSICDELFLEKKELVSHILFAKLKPKMKNEILYDYLNVDKVSLSICVDQHDLMNFSTILISFEALYVVYTTISALLNINMKMFLLLWIHYSTTKSYDLYRIILNSDIIKSNIDESDLEVMLYQYNQHVAMSKIFIGK